MEGEMSQLNTMTKEKIIMHNIYMPSAYEATIKVEKLISELQTQEKQLIEVSFDHYERVMEHLQSSLKEQANSNYKIKKGAFTYEQVRHIAEACCLHELHILETGELQLDSTVLCMSSVIAFAQSKWNGADRQTAIKNAIYTGVSIFGESFAEEVILNHLYEMDESSIEVEASIKTAVVKSGSKVVAKRMATKVTQKAMISSAIAKKTITFFNANVVTGALVTGVLSTVDIIRTIKGELSPQQLLKNVTKTAASVAGGIIGMLLFGGIGLQIPTVSTAAMSIIGGIIGLILGSVLITKIVSKVLDLFIKDDAVKMLAIFNEVFAERSAQYLLNEEELRQAISDFNSRPQMKSDLRDMYAAENRLGCAQKIIDLELTRIVNYRMYLHIPTDQEIYKVLAHI